MNNTTTIEKDLQSKIDLKTKPLGSLGMLEEIAFRIGKIQNTLSPTLSHPVALVFAADHGIADLGVSPCPKEVTYQMVYNFLNGGAAINVFSEQYGFNLKVIDAGVDHDFDPQCAVINKKIAYGTQNMLDKPAMTIEQLHKAIDTGKACVREEVQNGCNIIALGEMGIGNTSVASLLAASILGKTITECTGRGAGHNKKGVEHKAQILEKIFSKYPSTKDPYKLLATFGGFEVAMMTGAFLEAKQQNIAILVDGVIATAALLVACEINSEVVNNCFFGHLSDEKIHHDMVSYLGGEAILKLHMRLGEGSGALLAYPLIQSSVAFLNKMSSFEEAGVSQND